jgi:hypothetical protein
VLVLDMIEILPPLRKYKYDTWRILPVKCYIDNSVRLRSCIRNIYKDDEGLDGTRWPKAWYEPVTEVWVGQVRRRSRRIGGIIAIGGSVEARVHDEPFQQGTCVSR